MTRHALLLALLIALPLSGCKQKDEPAKDGPAGDGGKKPFESRPKGGSSTILGKSRDRVLDARLMNEMRQVTTAIEADLGGKSPANKAGWLAMLQGYNTLRSLLSSDEAVVFMNVDLRRAGANTVLMYETRVETENDGLVLTCDGTPHRMNAAQLAALTKPK